MGIVARAVMAQRATAAQCGMRRSLPGSFHVGAWPRANQIRRPPYATAHATTARLMRPVC
jgi:hypothetical protein